MSNSSSSAEKDKGDCSANFMKEWEKARDVVKDYDASLHDLRKFGFTFITTLLAAESLILPSRLLEANLPDVKGILPEETKFAVLFVTLLLILALQFIDRNYLIIQGAASKRAMILEKRLNLELTYTIGLRYGAFKVRDYFMLIYFAFVAAVVVIGGFALGPTSIFFLALVCGAVAASLAVRLIVRYSIEPPYPLGRIDWSVDRIDCIVGDEVEITLTSLDKKDHDFPRGTTMWQIVKEGDSLPLKTEITRKQIHLQSRDTYTWLWKVGIDVDKDIGKFEAGIFRLYIATLDRKGKPIKPKLCKIITLKINEKPVTSVASKRSKLTLVERSRLVT